MQQKPAQILIEALPYIQKFFGKTMVIKIGGSVLDDEHLQAKLIQDIVLFKFVGISPVIVHGGGKHISHLLERLGKNSQFVKGIRITDKETLEVTQMVLGGLINKDLVSMIIKEGGNAVGISGKDGGLLTAKRIKDEKYDYGYVGDIEKTKVEVIHVLKKNDMIPVISPFASDEDGQSLNVNADLAATEIAVALKAEKLIFLTDIDGVLRDLQDPSTLIQKILVKQIPEFIEKKIVRSGMIPKLQSAGEAIQRGIDSIHILNGKREHSLLLELFTHQGVGTQILEGMP